MPSAITHHEFSKKTNIKNKTDIYYFFSQSHDYFFYNYSKRIKYLAHTCQTTKTREYILNIINYIKDNNLIDNIDCTSYLYGVLSHYILDSTTHPFICYYTGTNKKVHRTFELTIDNFYSRKPYHIIKINYTKELIDCINYAYEKTYNIKNAAKLIRISSICAKPLLYFKYKYKKVLPYQILNVEHKVWNHPCIKEKLYKYSFIDLFNQALNEYNNLSNNIDKYLHNKINKLDIPNVSYATGLDLDHNKKMKYFYKQK